MDYNPCIGGGGISISDNEDMIRDILSRLPVKSLMRFKCVCKHFQYLIEEDEYLIDLHYKRSKTRPGLIIIVPRFYLATPVGHALTKEISFLSADIVLGENGNNVTTAIVHTVRNTKDDKFKGIMALYEGKEKIQYNHILKPVNGLICFVYWKLRYTVTFCIYNVSTREVMIITNSAFFRETRKELYDYSCRIACASFQLGFDPIKKEHKLMAAFTVHKYKYYLRYHTVYYTVCEVLTLGTNTWRRIEGVPSYNFPSSSVSVNGSIYWHCKTNISVRKCFDNTEQSYDKECPSIVAFDVGSEKFRVIPIPGFLISQSYTEREICSLAVDEQLAYFCREFVSRSRRGKYCGTAKLWIFDDDHRKENKTASITTNASNNMNWTEEIISLPSDWGYFFVECHDIAGSDQLILTCYNYSEFVSVHSYNRKRKTFSKIEISGIGHIPDILYAYLFTTFAEKAFSMSRRRNSSKTCRPMYALMEN